MNIKEIFSKAGSFSSVIGFIILLFVWNAINDVYVTTLSNLPGVGYALLPWVLKLLVGPVLLAAVYGGIYERQTTQNELERKNFFQIIQAHLLRFLGANILSILLLYIALIAAVIIAGEEASSLSNNNLLPAILSAFSSTLTLFWFSALVVEPKLLRSLAHAVKTMLFTPAALIIGLIWFAFVLADDLVFGFPKDQMPLAINLGRAGVFALLKVLAVMFLLVIYNHKWGNQILSRRAAEDLNDDSKSHAGEGLAKAGLGFAFFSFIPFLHLVALILGLASLKRRHGFILKAAIAAWTGGFFTILYALLVVGYFVGQTSTVRMPDYTFLASANEEARPYADLLGQGSFVDVVAQLGDPSAVNPEQDWTMDTALALAEYESGDLDSALKDFLVAFKKQPDRSEFYFFYGLALLGNDEAEMAKEQFQLALNHEPKLELAGQYVGLIQNRYQPDIIGSALLYLVILMILFPLHEYGHAFAAWKLGDDTARLQGRLTLNPVAHLDLFGSILLPAILLLQQSSVLFGWARPVPVDPKNFKNPKKDDMLVSFAGPAVNLMVSMVCIILLIVVMLITRLLWPETLSLNLVDPFAATSMVGSPFSKAILVLILFLKQMFYTSLILGLFNLLPVPPLDGSWILSGMLPLKLHNAFEGLRRFGFLLLILLTLTPVLDYLLGVPIGIIWIGLRGMIATIGFA